MGIVYAGLTPHAPILLSPIGMSHKKRVKDTLQGMVDLSLELKRKDPETLILITPHGPMQSHRLTLFDGPKISGDFSPFGYPNLKVTINLDEDFNRVLKRGETKDFLSFLEGGDSFTLDHGAMVPLFFFQERGLHPDVVLLSMGLLEREESFSFGLLLSSICKNLEKRVAIIASGDLSHRLTPEAPAGYSPKGKVFDEIVQKALDENNPKTLLQLDHNIIVKAGECGLKPLLLMMGAIGDLPFKGKNFSYQGPFGVGYLVSGFQERDAHG